MGYFGFICRYEKKLQGGPMLHLAQGFNKTWLRYHCESKHWQLQGCV